MANAWFRMYAEFADDPKVQIMSEAMQRRLVMLFCEKCKDATLHETELAFHWRISETELAETKAVFIAKGFIDEEWNLLNWNKRQFLSDSSTERSRRFRQRKKHDATLHETDATEAKREDDVTATVPDTDTDTEQIQKQQAHFVLPDWVNSDSWKGYEEMRKRIRKPMTNRARTLAIADLELLRSHGEDPAAVLDQSTMNGWQGLFELRRTGSNGHHPPPMKPITLAEKMARQVAQA